ncbi:MAG: histidine phosphatase family protein, partial [Thermoplasmata archaeon]|nr:histidine phosphatase family protein [Thermoplasmata archaeon]
MPRRTACVTTQLFLVRHGPAESRDPLQWPEDDDRPLSPDGVKETRKAARGLVRLELPVTQVISSPARRARQTAEIVREALKDPKPLELWEELAPDSPSAPVLGRVSRRGRRAGGVLLVGHEPVMSELVGLALTGESVSMVHFARAGAA